jgi:hypothetical protein
LLGPCSPVAPECARGIPYLNPVESFDSIDSIAFLTCGKIGHREIECRASKQTVERGNAAVGGHNNGRRKQHQDNMVLMAVEEYDLVNHDSHEIQDSFFDRFTYESDNDYDDSYDLIPTDDGKYNLVSMPTEHVSHEWSMMTTEEVIMEFVEENPNQIEDMGSNLEEPGSNIKEEEVAATAVEPSFQLSRVAVGEATRHMGTILKDGRGIGARESYVPACRGTIKNEDRRPSRRPHTSPGQRGFCNECDDVGPTYEECSSCQSAPNWVRGAFYYPGSPDDPGWNEPLLYIPFTDDRAGELRYETWEYMCEVYGYMGFTRKCAIDMGLRKEIKL